MSEKEHSFNPPPAWGALDISIHLRFFLVFQSTSPLTTSAGSIGVLECFNPPPRGATQRPDAWDHISIRPRVWSDVMVCFDVSPKLSISIPPPRGDAFTLRSYVPNGEEFGFQSRPRVRRLSESRPNIRRISIRPRERPEAYRVTLRISIHPPRGRPRSTPDQR